MNKKIQHFGVAIFATMTAAGTAVLIPDDAALLKDGTFSVKILYKNEAVENANLSLIDLNSKKQEKLRTDAFGFGREYSPRKGFIGNKYHSRPPGSYAIIVNKEGVPGKKVRFFLEEEGFTEKVILIKDPRKKRNIQPKVVIDAFWEEKSPMPVSKINTSANTYNRHIYLFGGWRKRYLNSVEVYSPVRDRWATGTPLKHTRDHHSSSLVGRKIYIIAGHNKANEGGLRVTEIYTPAKDTWSLGSPIPSRRFDHSSSTFKREIFVFGGRQAADSLEIYNTQTDTWRIGSRMPTKRYSHSSHVINRRIYLVGGRYSKQILDTVEEYDPIRDKWTRKAPLPEGRYSHSGCVINDQLYIFGGKGADGSVFVYDPKSDKWTQGVHMPINRYNTSCSEFDGKAYLLAGNGGWSRNDAYSPQRIQ